MIQIPTHSVTGRPTTFSALPTKPSLLLGPAPSLQPNPKTYSRFSGSNPQIKTGQKNEKDVKTAPAPPPDGLGSRREVHNDNPIHALGEDATQGVRQVFHLIDPGDSTWSTWSTGFTSATSSRFQPPNHLQHGYLVDKLRL